MKCISEGALRAHLDHQLDSLEAESIARHLGECPTCQERWNSLSAVSARVGRHLNSLEAPADETCESAAALARFKAAHAGEEGRAPFFATLFSPGWRYASAGVLAAGILIGSLAFPSARGFAQRLLATLRIERVQTLPIDFASLQGPANHGMQEAFGQMISDKMVVTANEKEQSAASIEEAGQLAGFPVRHLALRADAPSIEIEGRHAFHLTIDRRRLQELLDQAGRTDLILPAALDGATLSVNVPRAVGLKYGSCGERRTAPENSSPTSEPAAKADCVALIEAPSPTIDVPADLNLQQVAETALQLSGMGAVEARKLCQTIDWQSTLVIPVPRFVRSYETVTVNGVQGTLMQTPAHHGQDAVLIWVKDGTIYALFGSLDKQKILELAASLE